MSMNDKERMANDARMNDRFNRGLARKARKGDYGAAKLLGEIQGGRLDFTGSFGIRNANQDRDLNIGQNRVDQKNQEMWADQGAGEIPEPNQAPKAAEPQRQVGPNASMGAGYDKPLQRANGARPTNPGTKADRAEVGNAPTLAEQPEAIDNGGMAPSATRPAATSPARQETAGNVIPAKTNYAKVAQDAFKSDLEKSNLIKTGLDYEAGKAPEEVKAAQQKALERGLSLGGNREQLQAMIGMETDSAAKARKDQEYQYKFGDSDEKYKALLDRTLTEKDKAAGVADKMFKALSPEDRLDSISKLAKGPSEKTKALLLEAKQKAAARTGYTGEVTADTDFGEEAKAAIPGAQIGAKALIDARELLPGKEGDATFQAETDDLKRLRGFPVASFDETGSPDASKFFKFGEGKEEKPKEDPFTFNNLLGDGSSYKAPKPKDPDKTPSSPDKPESSNPILADLSEASTIWGSRWDRDASFIQKQHQAEGDNAISLIQNVGGGIINAVGSLVGGRTGESIKSGASNFKKRIGNLKDSDIKKTEEEQKLPKETSKVVRKLFDTNQKVIADRNFFLGKEEEPVPS